MNHKTERLYLIIIILLLVTCGILAIFAYIAHSDTHTPTANTSAASATDASDPSFIVIDKGSLTLSVIDRNGRQTFLTGIACGKAPGDKIKPGDMRTPEGIFCVKEIQDASSWSHDFNDGKGKIDGCYGNWFIRLDTPGHSGIGIHGTHDPASIGTRATEGCIRLENSELEKLHSIVTPGMKVVILPGADDERDNNRANRTDA